MEWADLKRVDTLIQETKSLGACIEEIGVSGEGRSLYGITVGDQNATKTVLIAAGFHADEVIGPLTAVSMLQILVQNPPANVRFGIIPVADPDFLHRNASELSTTVTMLDILKLSHHRDLEGYFTTNTYPECVAIRKWIQQFNRIDAYLSLHSAHLIAPGLFFYVGSISNPLWINQVISHVTAVVPDYLSLLSYDPTGLSQKVLSSGFFELAIPEIKQLNSANPGSSLAFVAHHFHSQFIGASEIPLAICPQLANVSLHEIDRYNREFKQTGYTNYTFQEIDLKTQLEIMQALIWGVIQCAIAI
ncbi:MAG: M14 family zinc carboxypeptidase [Nostochopsis sp.]